MSPEPKPGGGLDTALVVGGGVVIGAGCGAWFGARSAVLLSGGKLSGGLDVWLRATGRLLRGATPVAAWGPNARGLPPTWLYWTCTIMAFMLLAAAGWGLWWVWRRLDPARSERRRRFGQPTDARQARPGDVAPLVVPDIVPPTGRMLLGRMAGGRLLLATEDLDRHPLDGKAARRQGNRGSVALIGPTGSGKTALAASAIATWDGPVVAVSVERDLYDTTAAARAQRGEIAVFDPGGATRLPTARWSPLEATVTSTGALRTGRALAQAIPKGGVTNAEYWAEHGEALLGAFMCVAGLARLLRNQDGAPVHRVGMEQLATWVRTLAVATDPVINDLLRRALDKGQPLEVQLLGRHAAVTFVGVARQDHKVRSSVYSTAVLALKPWLEPAVAHSASDHPQHRYDSPDRWELRPRFVDLEWLMAGEPGRANTLYLAASQPEFARLSPVLGGLLADLKDSIHAWDIAGRRLDKPLLFVIDEAGQLELGWLPAEVSTIAALHAFFVTCWQSLSQMHHRYTTLADAVLSGHRTKCFFAGVDDLATTRYLSTLLGHEHVIRRTASHDLPNPWGHGNVRRSVAESTQREEFAPANTLRQMYPGEAVLLHGTLPPVHLDAVRWWKEPDLNKLVPIGPTGNPEPPAELATCPLTDCRAGSDSAVVDAATIATTLAQLPQPEQRPEGNQANRTAASTTEGPPIGVSDTGKVGGTCGLCGRAVERGKARLDRRGGHTITRCDPAC